MPWIEQLWSVNWADAGCIFLAAYALGCLTTGYYLVRRRTGQDLRILGSGSIGARNVSRLLGWRGFLVTVLGDFGKGALAVWAARHFTAIYLVRASGGCDTVFFPGCNLPAHIPHSIRWARGIFEACVASLLIPLWVAR